MPNDRQWLQAEHSGEDALAEMLFARLMAEIPPIEAGPDFVGRTAQAAWRSRTRRRFVKALAGVVAVLSIGFAGFASIYELRGLAVGLSAWGTAMLSHGLVWLLTSASAAIRWWWIADRIGTAVSGTIVAPSVVAAVAAMEMIALLAIVALKQLVHENSGTQDSGKVRL
jgi:hypothetical protein